MPELSELLHPLVKKRGGYKSCITVALKKLEALGDDELTRESFLRRQESIDQYLQKVQSVNEDILDVFLSKDIDEDDPSKLAEITLQVEYADEVHDRLAKVERKLNSASQPDATTSKPAFAVKLPKLQCKKFDGETPDKLEFKNFLLQFNNCIDAAGQLSNSNKLTYLRGYLTGYAFKVISHLSISDDNYKVAIDLLKDEFLDIPYIIDESFKELLSKSPKFDTDFVGVRSYINECRAIIYELKQYKVDLVDKDAAGCKLISHIIFSKLPVSVKRELMHKVNCNYPTIGELFDHYKDIVQTLIRTSSYKSGAKTDKKDSGVKSKGAQPTLNKPGERSKVPEKPTPSTLENFNTTVENKSVPKGNDSTKGSVANSNSGNSKPKYCKFCSGFGHSMSYCTKYEKVADRQARCASLGLCGLCTSSKHDASKCPGKDNKLSFSCYSCKRNEHITALCPSARSGSTSSNLCINVQHVRSDYQPFLLPVLSLEFHGVNRSRVVRCLIDTGSQRSYIAGNVVRELRSPMGMPSINYDVITFLGASERQFGECMLDVAIPGYRKLPVAVLSDPNFDIRLHVSQLDVAVHNIVQEGYTLAEPSLANDGENIPIQGLIGVDIIQFIPDFQVVKCMLGAAWNSPCGVIPFGNVINYLRPEQISPIGSHDQVYKAPKLEFPGMIPKEEEIPSTLVNFVLSPKKTYFSPLETLFPDSAVEQGLENMFSLDSLGCKEKFDQVSKYDEAKIEEFQKGIFFKDGKYHVSLPWKEDLVEKVPSNHKVALSVLNRVVNNLQQKGLLTAYQNVFHKQLEDGIIERINVDPKDFENFVWIPHRPVFKDEVNVTTKIRPVFNCSLKTNNAPSLNEAAYAGINLMGDIVKLSLYFRSNDYVMLSDIKQAFLQIMLAKEEDKNKFCFFMREGDELVAYRYKTIIFGFNASPFILNYVIKHHANQFAYDEFAQILKSNFYVDNLIVTGNSPRSLERVYLESVKRMSQGGFCLRSWNSNNSELQNLMNEKGDLVSHGSNYEKVLGLKYSLENDSIQLADSSLDPLVNTKRGILSQISKVFDPLGLLLPVTTKGKLLMRELWGLKLAWDEVVPDQIQKEWCKHCTDLSLLSNVSLPRSCVDEDTTNSLCIFCDASKSSYGFAVYNVCNGKSQLLFAKSRVAPVKPKTLPMLELLGVYLAMKCLPMVLDSFTAVKFQNVTIAVDSQIVLQWLLADTVNTKSIFTRNRIKDIGMFKEALRDQHGVSIKFKYVRSEDNPCDLITRGLTYAEFEKNLAFWLSGPAWLPTYESSWPESSLGCLSVASKLQMQPSKGTASFNIEAGSPHIRTLIDLEKFSDFNKLLRVTGYVFKAINNFKKSEEDSSEMAKLYLIKQMQKDCFPQELTYLFNPKDKNMREVPVLVNNLDLFLDKNGVMRSKGRIGKSLHYGYEVLNPVLLAKDHRLTYLIVEFYHKKCKHLGIQTTLNTIRASGFWIPRMRQVVKGILHQCMTCKRFNSLAFKYPRMTDLPKHRVNFIKPFQHTGVDFTGHLWVKNEKDENVKMYLLIFTCLNVRAVHIELVPDMSTHSFVMAFLRFVNLYGIPSHVYSDNARSFVAGCQVLEQALVCDEFKEHFQSYNVQHIKIPVYSAWVGATWERLIGTVKSCLYKTVGRAKLTYFELLTVIGDVQAAINSRPLTYRSSENNLEAITPSCFFRFDANSHLLLRQVQGGNLWDKEPPSRESFIATLSARDEIFDHFRELWYESYLLSLRESCKDLHQCNWENKISVGDVVIVKMLNKSRPYWLLGIVLELVMGLDNKVRSVKLKRGDGAVVHHSINHLYPMELSLSHNRRVVSKVEQEETSGELVEPGEKSQAPSPSTSGGSAPSVRPRRDAATACRDKMSKWCAQLSN